jgi:RNA polymerase sigma-70 factor (ECF subfamily)
VAGPGVALAEVDQLTERLADYHLLHATRAELLTQLGDPAAARTANERALALTSNPVEQELLRSRLAAEIGLGRRESATHEAAS